MDTIELIDGFFRGLGIGIDSLTIEEQDDVVAIDLQTPDSALLIGTHGKNIQAMRHLLARMLEKKCGKFLHIHLEINDYMKSKDLKLERTIDKHIAALRGMGGQIPLPKLTAFERKKAHDYVANTNIHWLSSESRGEWKERVLYLIYTGPIVTHTPQIPTPDNLSEDDVGI